MTGRLLQLPNKLRHIKLNLPVFNAKRALLKQVNIRSFGMVQVCKLTFNFIRKLNFKIFNGSSSGHDKPGIQSYSS